MLPELFAMIGCPNEERVILQPHLPQRFQKAPNLGVRAANRAVVPIGVNLEQLLRVIARFHKVSLGRQIRPRRRTRWSNLARGTLLQSSSPMRAAPCPFPERYAKADKERSRSKEWKSLSSSPAKSRG